MLCYFSLFLTLLVLLATTPTNTAAPTSSCPTTTVHRWRSQGRARSKWPQQLHHAKTFPPANHLLRRHHQRLWPVLSWDNFFLFSSNSPPVCCKPCRNCPCHPHRTPSVRRARCPRPVPAPAVTTGYCTTRPGSDRKSTVGPPGNTAEREKRRSSANSKSKFCKSNKWEQTFKLLTKPKSDRATKSYLWRKTSKKRQEILTLTNYLEFTL